MPHDAAERSAGELVLASIRGRQRVAIGAGLAAGDAVLAIAGLAGSVLPVLVVGLGPSANAPRSWSVTIRQKVERATVIQEVRDAGRPESVIGRSAR